MELHLAAATPVDLQADRMPARDDLERASLVPRERAGEGAVDEHLVLAQEVEWRPEGSGEGQTRT